MNSEQSGIRVERDDIFEYVLAGLFCLVRCTARFFRVLLRGLSTSGRPRSLKTLALDRAAPPAPVNPSAAPMLEERGQFCPTTSLPTNLPY